MRSRPLVITSLILFASGLALVGSTGSALGQSLPSGVPCSALADAVVSNTGQVFSDASSTINGNVQVATTLVRNGGVINGTVTQNDPPHLPVISPPASATNLGVFLVNSGQTRTLSAGNYVASSFTVNSAGTLTVTGGQVNVWVTGALTLGGAENSGGVPTNLEFLVTGTQDANINAGGAATVPAIIYAPNARVNVFSNVLGTVVGSTVTVNSGGAVTNFNASAQCSTTTPGSCLPSSSLTVLVSNKNATAYVPLSDWEGTGVDGVRVVPLEGSGPHVTIATPNQVNSCAASFGSGQVVCTANDTDVYLINGTTLTSTLTSAATAPQVFSGTGGNSVFNAGVAIDPAHNRAVVSVGLSSGVAGFQFLDLGSHTFSSPVALNAMTSEDVVVDPVRNLVLSPNEQNDYILVQTGTSSVANFDPPGVPSGTEFDSAAEDCSTGLALSSLEFGSGQIFLTNLTKATFSGSTWSAPSAVQAIPEFAALNFGTNGIAVTPGSHLGVTAGEFGGSAFGVMQLPPDPAALALSDWVVANIPNDPSGQPWAMGRDPHTLTAYVSPNSGKSLAVFVNASRTFLAVVDLQAVLSGSRSAHTSTANPSTFVTFVGL